MTPDHEAAMRIAEALLDPRSQIVFANDQIGDDDLDVLARAYLAQSAELSALRAHQKGCVERWRAEKNHSYAIAYHRCADELENMK